MIAICFEGATELNAWMVSEGWAVAYRRYSNDYVMQEQQAEAAGKNIWSSRFVMPWDWRRGKRREGGCGQDSQSHRVLRVQEVPSARKAARHLCATSMILRKSRSGTPSYAQ